VSAESAPSPDRQDEQSERERNAIVRGRKALKATVKFKYRPLVHLLIMAVAR